MSMVQREICYECKTCHTGVRTITVTVQDGHGHGVEAGLAEMMHVDRVVQKHHMNRSKACKNRKVEFWLATPLEEPA